MRRTLLTALALTTALTATTAATVTTATATGTATAALAPIPPRTPLTDFNHDGYADLALGAPGGAVGGKQAAGVIAVVYGSKNGADVTHARVLSRDSARVPGTSTGGEYFGERTATGDLDGDGFTDLVVGSVNGSHPVVLWGSATGLSGAGAVSLPGGSGLFSVGDFNGDGHRDLVTDDYPRSDDPDDDDAGMTVSYGPFHRTTGAATRTDTIVTSQTFGPQDFVVGDVTGDGADDIVTSHGFEEAAYASKFWKGGADGVAHTSTSLTSSLAGAVADVDGDGYGDLVVHDIGDNYEDIAYEKGTVRVLYGSAAGPSSTRTTAITQETSGVPGSGESGDQFGTDIAAGDVNGDGFADIAVGVPGEAIGDVTDAGAVVLLKGGRGGLSGAGAQAFHQSTPGIPGASEKGDRFGLQVLLSDLDGDKHADLTAAAPLEDGTYRDSGATWLLRGTPTGLTTTATTSFGPATLHAPVANAQLGRDLGR
ncbi:FG-GAP and VCBS repeat-containing protein [Streptomyces sp. NPDC046939]|uniref:FG-GAP and VCBS repeat-containing protein n=1 Tax=Streptomyces sp. NPDC046939 TaxID=3155376 RepID=UPI0033C74350